MELIERNYPLENSAYWGNHCNSEHLSITIDLYYQGDAEPSIKGCWDSHRRKPWMSSGAIAKLCVSVRAGITN